MKQRSASDPRHTRAGWTAIALAVAASTSSHATGVSPYLPLQLSPGIERQIERVMILADQPILHRPIAAVAVLDALPKACPRDPQLCQRVRRYLAAYTHDRAITDASLEVGAGSNRVTLPNQHGAHSDDTVIASASALWQPSAYATVSLGAVADDERTTPTGSVLSLGTASLQLDAGYRDHWFSPFTDSSMLISTEAPTLPSLTLHNSMPLTRLALEYELFLAHLSESDRIVANNVDTRGYPRLLGLHLGSQPVAGWSVGINRLMQFGGGGRSDGLTQVLRALVNPHNADNNGGGTRQELGNQQSSFVASFIYPGRTPFSAYVEYAGEDTSHSRNYLLGNSSLALGLHLPSLWQRFDLTYEISEWQNSWWTHHLYGDGMTNYGSVIGHWGGDWRRTNELSGARTQMLKLSYEHPDGDQYLLQLRQIRNQEDATSYHYRVGYEATLGFERPAGSWSWGSNLSTGRDVFGSSFGRATLFARFAGEDAGGFADDTSDQQTADAMNGERYVSAGYGTMRVRYQHDTQAVTIVEPSVSGIHLAAGARRAVSTRGDLGMRLDVDQLGNRLLVSVRALDYRYRLVGPLALTAFGGATRYAAPTPALGWYLGGGLQWRNVLPRTDLDLDYRAGLGLQRDRLLSGASEGAASPDEFYTLSGPALYLTHRF